MLENGDRASLFAYVLETVVSPPESNLSGHHNPRDSSCSAMSEFHKRHPISFIMGFHPDKTHGRPPLKIEALSPRVEISYVELK